MILVWFQSDDIEAICQLGDLPWINLIRIFPLLLLIMIIVYCCLIYYYSIIIIVSSTIFICQKAESFLANDR